MSRFRITHWPAARIDPITDILKVRSVEATDDGVLIAESGDQFGHFPAHELVDIQPELYLRDLGELQLDSDSEVYEFVHRFGFMGAAQLEGRVWLPARPQVNGISALRIETLDEFRFLARNIRNMTSIWISHLLGRLTDGPLEWEGDLPSPASERQSLRVLEETLNQALSGFHAGIQVFEPDDDGLVDRLSVATLYETLALQLFAHISEGAHPRTCQNEKCDTRFVRQQGRAKNGQHHTSGVIYCSHSCSNAQANRDLRRRKRNQRTQQKDN